MARQPVTYRAWAGSARAGRCRWCRHAIVWVVTDRGAWLPFDLGFTVREIVTRPEDSAQFVVLHRDDRHGCAERRAALGRKTNERSQREAE